MDSIKAREVVRNILTPKKCTWFFQAILEETGLVSVSLGGKESLVIFYDKIVEQEVFEMLQRIRTFCEFEILGGKVYNNDKKRG